MKRVSLIGELDLVRAAVRAVIALVERLHDVPMRQHGLPVDLAESMRASLVLVDTRLRDLERLARGVLDPEVAWISATNAHADPAPGGEGIVFEWTEKQRQCHHKGELRRLRRRHRHQQRRSGR